MVGALTPDSQFGDVPFKDVPDLKNRMKLLFHYISMGSIKIKHGCLNILTQMNEEINLPKEQQCSGEMHGSRV